MKEVTIYRTDGRIAACLRKLEESQLSAKNKQVILDFYHCCLSENLSKHRLAKLIYTVRMLAEMLGNDFDQATKKDIESLVRKMHEQDWEAWTLYGYKVIIKKLYKWLKSNNELYPEEVRWIKPRIECNEKKLPSDGDLLNEQEVQNLITAAPHPRDKAFISTLYESGCRLSEVATMKIANAAFDDLGCVVV